MNAGRSGGRRGRALKRKTTAASHFDAAWRQIKNPYPPIEQFSVDEIEAIHTATMTVLSEIGIKVLSAEAREIYVKAGMTHADDQVIRFDPDLLLDLIAKAPSEFTLHSRNRTRDLRIGGNNVALGTAGGAPNFSSLQNPRHPGTQADFDNILRVAYSFDVIHMAGVPVEPQDVPPNLRHYGMVRSAITLADKISGVYFRGRQVVADSFEMLRIAHGLTPEEFTQTPLCLTVANSNSPLQLDHLMCAGIIDAARMGQMMILTPFTLAGAMAPVTIPGALVMQNAEALSGLALSQIVRPGVPVCYGSFTSNVDMKTGAPAFGTPEYVRAAFASGQLARRYGLPLRSSGPTASNTPDAQGAYESQMSLWGALMGGANIVMHAAGWLEGGLTFSAEKMILDIEVLQMFAEIFKPLPVNDATLGLEAIRNVGHGGHFFGTQHTLERFETAFYSPLVSDWSNYENWAKRGSVDATTRANKIFHERVAAHEPPPLDPSRLEEIDDFIARRTAEGGADLSR